MPITNMSAVYSISESVAVSESDMSKSRFKHVFLSHPHASLHTSPSLRQLHFLVEHVVHLLHFSKVRIASGAAGCSVMFGTMTFLFQYPTITIRRNIRTLCSCMYPNIRLEISPFQLKESMLVEVFHLSCTSSQTNRIAQYLMSL